MQAQRNKLGRFVVDWAPPPEERFWPKVDKDGPLSSHRPDLGACWLWTASCSRGYGLFVVAGRKIKAHRYAYELLLGPIPKGLQIDHLCRVPSCVNPTHLEVVTQRENILRGTGASARHARQTHCKRGHEFTPENTRIDCRGSRECRTCRHILRRERYRRDRAGVVVTHEPRSAA